MKIVKCIMIIFVLFIFCGCDIKYNITYINDGTNEEIVVEDLNDNLRNDLIDPVQYFFQGYPYNIVSNNNNSTMKQEWLSVEDFMDNSILINKILDSNSIVYNGKKVSFDLNISNEMNDYFELYGKPKKIDFSITVPYYVSSHNATSVSGNTYTWVIDDIENANIKINFDMSKSADYVINIVKVVVICVLVIMIIGVIIYFVNRNKKVNEI